MTRVFFVTGSKGGVGKSVGAIALLDYFEMRNRQVSLVETDTANPDVGKAAQKDVKSFSLVNLDENEGWLDLLDIVDASKDDEVVVNTAARNNEGVNRYGSMFDEKLNEFGWPFISLFLINQQRDSCEMLTEYMNVVLQSCFLFRVQSNWGRRAHTVPSSTVWKKHNHNRYYLRRTTLATLEP